MYILDFLISKWQKIHFDQPASLSRVWQTWMISKISDVDPCFSDQKSTSDTRFMFVDSGLGFGHGLKKKTDPIRTLTGPEIPDIWNERHFYRLVHRYKRIPIETHRDIILPFEIIVSCLSSQHFGNQETIQKWSKVFVSLKKFLHFLKVQFPT